MKTKTVNISLPNKLLEEIDRKAKEEYKSRSELIREAALQYIQGRDNWELFRIDAAQRAKNFGIKTEDDVEKMVDSTRKFL
ncbi:MAG: ribbon-helix-helix domain-containing protein [Candidatus Berkelbacteria bacterium]|nr:ribbon-helix-helix domain-containing protein [Candidatus Berkelbacteria bacterium]